MSYILNEIRIPFQWAVSSELWSTLSHLVDLFLIYLSTPTSVLSRKYPMWIFFPPYLSPALPISNGGVYISGTFSGFLVAHNCLHCVKCWCFVLGQVGYIVLTRSHIEEWCIPFIGVGDWPSGLGFEGILLLSSSWDSQLQSIEGISNEWESRYEQIAVVSELVAQHQYTNEITNSNLLACLLKINILLFILHPTD